MEMTILDIIEDCQKHIRVTFETLRHILSTRGFDYGRKKLWVVLRELEAQGYLEIEKRGHGYFFKVSKPIKVIRTEKINRPAPKTAYQVTVQRKGFNARTLGMYSTKAQAEMALKVWLRTTPDEQQVSGHVTKCVVGNET